MPRAQRSPSSATARASRQDGRATRQQILEVAGEVFALRGYADATSKEICRRAGANAAAVNYHFGGKEGLYCAVLIEAHRHIVTLEELSELARGTRDARDKLRMFIARLLRDLSSTRASAWEFRVLGRELLSGSPSPMLIAMLKSEAAPKARILRSMVAEIMQLPVDDPAVIRSLINILAPCMLLLLGHRKFAKKVLPSFQIDPEVLTQHMLTYALAGLEAVAKERKAKTR
jgi:AcrR family transcriptional regulator